jgi:DNA-binding transcriptional LysR family regulator
MNTIMLNTFVVAALTGSVSETARRLRYGKSTVLYHIREVEKDCRTELFERDVRGLSLTCRGRMALKISQQLLRTAAQLTALSLGPTRTDRTGAVVDVDGNVLNNRKSREFI